MAFEIQQILKAIKKNFIAILLYTNFQCEIASNYKRQPVIKYPKSIQSTKSMVNTTIRYDYIIITIIVAPASTRPDPRGRGQDPRSRGQDLRGRGHKILASRGLEARPRGLTSLVNSRVIKLKSILIQSSDQAKWKRDKKRTHVF